MFVMLLIYSYDQASVCIYVYYVTDIYIYIYILLYSYDEASVCMFVMLLLGAFVSRASNFQGFI